MDEKIQKQGLLESRTTQVAVDVIRKAKLVKITPLNSRIIDQLIGSSGSIGANYREANACESKKDFIHKISIVKKEIKETLHWIELLVESSPELRNDMRVIWKEVHELLLIFSKILSTSKLRK